MSEDSRHDSVDGHNLDDPCEAHEKPGDEPRESMVPWKQRDGETRRAYDIFRRYLALGPDRTLRAAAEAAGHRNPSTVEGWSRQHDWIARAAAYDDHQIERKDAVADEVRELFIREMVRDRVALQRSYHRHLHSVPDYLHDIARDAEAPPSARVAACKLIIKQAGYEPIEPPKQDDRADEMVVNELLRMSQILAEVDAQRADVFDRLIEEAHQRREAQRRAAAGEDDEAD